MLSVNIDSMLDFGWFCCWFRRNIYLIFKYLMVNLRFGLENSFILLLKSNFVKVLLVENVL